MADRLSLYAKAYIRKGWIRNLKEVLEGIEL